MDQQLSPQELEALEPLKSKTTPSAPVSLDALENQVTVNDLVLFTSPLKKSTRLIPGIVKAVGEGEVLVQYRRRELFPDLPPIVYGHVWRKSDSFVKCVPLGGRHDVQI